ncbi:MAG: ABC transporter transmembrane domain-containing protein [Alphaproteobacteria bacterium]|nr:ABC transporter transmembrane domain-containing protein [Alphaproteobacteria bacterium]
MTDSDHIGDKLEPNVFRFVFRYSSWQQVVIVFITAVSFPIYYVSLELPKQIINKAIGAEASQFPKSVTVFGHEIASLTQIELLTALSALFLVFLLANLAIKYVLNLYKGLLGERMLRRLRYQLFDRVIRFPLPRFRRIPKGDLVSMVTNEVESIGGFVGEALATPLYQGGLLVTALIFIFVQDWLMGLLAVAFYPIQVVVIPYLQTQVNELGRQRVAEIRRLSNKLNETVGIASEIHSNRTSRYELADFSSRLGRIFKIRYQIYHKKFLIKFLNNFFSQLTPLLFFGIGGYLVISSQMSLGELVAILAAYKDLAPPWRELLDFYQDQQNARIRYDQIVSTFASADPNLLEPALAERSEDGPPEGMLKGVGLRVEYDETLFLEDVSFEMRLDEHVAVLGPSDIENRHLAWLVAGLIEPTAGTLAIGGRSYSDIPRSWFETRVAYLDDDPGLTSGSILENIVYALKRDPKRVEAEAEAAPAVEPAQNVISEEQLTGNSTDDISADWIDYPSIGLSGPEDLRSAVLDAVAIADFTQEVFDLGLGAYVDPAAHPEIAEGIVAARRALRDVLAGGEFSGSVALLDPGAYNPHATVLENILFGDPIGPRYEAGAVLDRGIFGRVLKRTGLHRELLALGLEIARSLDSAPDETPLDGEALPETMRQPNIRVLLGHAALRGLHRITGREKRRLLSLALDYVASQDSPSRIDGPLIEKVLEARRLFAETLSPRQRKWIAPYDPESFCPTLTVSENILFAKIKADADDMPQRLRSAMLGVLSDGGFKDAIIEAGLLFQVGAEGSALSDNQKQKLAVARAIIKRPDLLVSCQATAGLGEATEERIIGNVREALRGRGILWITSDRNVAELFDRYDAI